MQFEQLRGALISYAKLSAESIDGDKHYKLSNYGNKNSPEYVELRKKVRILKNVDTKMAEMYTLIKTDKENIWKFVIDAAEPKDENADGIISDDEKPAKFGEEYDVSDYPEMKKAFGGCTADEQISQDKWGWWLSGYAPIYNSKKEAVAVLGIDFSADTIRREQARLKRLIFLMSAIFLGVGLIASNIFSLSLTGPIYKLIIAAEAIGKGNYDYRIKLKKRNEIGFLAETINSMAENIKRSFNKLSILHRTANILSSTLDLHQALKMALNLVLEVTRSEKGAIFLLNRQGDKLDMIVSEGLTIKSDEKYFFADSVKISKNLEQGWIDRIKKTMDTIGCAYSFVLSAKDNVRGLLFLNAEIKDMDFLNTLMKQVSFAIENAGLFHEAITDSLTGLYLRRYFQIQLEIETKRTKRYKTPLSFLMIDIDFFKKINDKFGHLAGDFVLAQISRLIKETLRDVDVVSRFGGEEISAVLPETNKNEALLTAERIRKAVENYEFEYKGKIIKVTISVGVFSISGEEELSSEQIIKNADLALYKAKSDGRNRVCGEKEDG
ncbi:diguanylate cyclase [bacterium]|nr:diguanylate cyclase [bacterium]